MGIIQVMSRINDNRLFEVTDVYTANLNSTCPINVNQGGTYSTKTYSIIQVLFTEGLQNPKEVITVVGQDIPNLKVGALRDAQNIVDSSRKLQSLIKSYNKSERIYRLYNDTVIEFMSYDDWQDAKSGKRDRLFINEVNGVPKRIYDELALRTAKKIYLDYNPNEEFWVHTELIGKPGVKFIRSDHRHNTFLTQVQHNKIEAIDDPELWKVYARGYTGKLEGVIFRNYNIVPKIPEGAKHIGTGLDFGFTNDVTAAVDVFMVDGELWLDELLYEQGLTNVPILGAEVQAPNISDRFKQLGLSGKKEIIGDSAEQKSVRELSLAGWNIQGAIKGPESIRTSIDILRRYKLNVTQRSYNLKKELNAYKWRQDKKTGKTLNEPVDFMNHLIDGLRYVALARLGSNVRTGKYVIV